MDSLDYFTVYDDHILMKSSVGYPSGETKIKFRDIERMSKGRDRLGSIDLEFEGKHKMMMELSITLFGATEMMRPEGTRDLDRLYQLLEKQRNQHRR